MLADLERRTKVARQHIEELANGRDRLLQVFERARLVAVDITSELQRVDGPEEFVSFAPTTGPVPLMVPASKLDQARQSVTNDDTTAIDVSDHVDDDTSDEAPVDQYVDGEPETDTGTATGDDTVVDDDAEASSEPADDVEPADSAEAADVDAAAETVENIEGDVAEPAPAGDPQVEPASRDTNVVALFPGRGEEPVNQDVDGIFARLRSESQTDVEPGEAPGSDQIDDQESVAPTAFSRRDEALVPLIVTAARKVKRVLADEQNGVLDTLRRKEAVTSLEAIVPAIDVHVATFLDTIADELGAATAAGAAEFGAKDTKTLRRTLDRAGALDATRALVRSDLVGPLRSRLERAVSEGAGDNDDTTRRVRAVYREWKTQHIDDQLDDVFRFAFGGGMAVTAEPGSPMVWAIDSSETACADCEDNSLAGAVAAGESFPTGHTAAPAHPGCRCLTLPAHQ